MVLPPPEAFRSSGGGAGGDEGKGPDGRGAAVDDLHGRPRADCRALQVSRPLLFVNMCSERRYFRLGYSDRRRIFQR